MARTADDDGRNLRGHSADRVVVDEAAFVRDRVVEEVISPMLADRNGQLVMISTPFGKNHFYRTFAAGQTNQCSRTKSFRFPSWANPHISREYIESQRSVLTERQFKAEYEAEFVDDQSSVFPWADIQAACAGWSMADGQWVMPDFSIKHSVRVAGIDWARYSDYTAVAVVEVFEEIPNSTLRFRVIALDRFNRMDWHSQVRRTADLLKRYDVRGAAADQTSVGDPVLEMLRETAWTDLRLDSEIEGVVFTNQSKREMVDNLAIRLANRELTFPPIDDLVKELTFYEYELTAAGNVKTGARSGYHDDCVMALSLALRVAPRYRSSGTLTTSGRVIESFQGW